MALLRYRLAGTCCQRTAQLHAESRKTCIQFGFQKTPTGEISYLMQDIALEKRRCIVTVCVILDGIGHLRTTGVCI